MSAFTSPYFSNYQQILLRGGRLGKIGKRAATYAPVLGLIGATALFGASSAQAGTSLISFFGETSDYIGGSSLASNVFILSNSAITIVDGDLVVDILLVDGASVLSTVNGVGGNTAIVVRNTFDSFGGTLVFDVDFAGNLADTMTVINVRGAPTMVGVNALNPSAANGETISLITAANANDDAFFMDNPVYAGAWQYDLARQGDDFVLHSILSPIGATYEVYASTLLNMLGGGGIGGLPSLQDRVGNRHWAGEEGAVGDSTFVFCKDPAQNFSCAVTPEQAQVYAGVPLVGTTIEGQGVWVRVDGARTEYNPVSSTGGTSYDARLAGLQVGYDHVIRETDAGDRLIGGVNLSYRTSNADVTAATGASTIDTTGMGLGGSLTWYQKNGFYVDAQAQVMSFKSDLSAGALGVFAEGHKVMGHALSLEVGKEIKLNESWSITPQAQLSYAKVKEDGYVDAMGANVSFAAESLQLRLGVEAAQETSWKADDETTSRRSLRAGVHVVKEFHPETVVNVSGTTLRSEGDDVTGEITLGGSYNWSDDKYSVYGTVGAGTGLNTFGDSTRMRGTVGMRLRWQ